MNDLVSILIPAYNAEKYIGQTIKSALDQTWPQKEIIIVDDGSTDSTFEIAKRFQSRNVKVITQNNTGACGARNMAFRLSQGNYIQWLDADDILAPEKISNQLKNGSNENTTKIVFTAAFGTFFYNTKRANFRENGLWQDLSPVDWIITKFEKNVWMNPTAWLISRRLTELGGAWDERLSGSGDDDGEYILRVVAASESVKFVSEAKCYYRIGNVGSLDWSMGASVDKLEALFLSLSLSISHLMKLEDSLRTRQACVKHLQTWLPLFHPERKTILEKIYLLAKSLGGELAEPKVKWKYYPIKMLFGISNAKKVQNNWRKLKMLTLRFFDRYF
jgi:glycosyltransferase involved in cell wall biosynthesis